MKRLLNKNPDEEHNFWMSYTDLMSGFLIVFIIAGLIAYKGFLIASQSKKDLIERVSSLEEENKKLTKERDYAVNKVGELENQIATLMVRKEDYDKIQQFIEAQKNLNSKYFSYNAKYQRFECKIDVQFEPNKYAIPSSNHSDLKAAGNELLKIIREFSTDNISFKVIIDGRAARNLDSDQNHKYFGSVQELSYNRARALYNLWDKSGIIKSIEKQDAEVFISGLGFAGINRYSGFNEYKNKTFIIQVIPYLKFSE